MSYLVTVYNKYADGSELKLKFDTDSVMLADVWMDAACEVMTYRMHNQMNYCERPLIEVISAKPTMSMRGLEK